MGDSLDLVIKAVSVLAGPAITALNNAIKKHKETVAATKALEKLDERSAEIIREIILNPNPSADFSDFIEELDDLEKKAGRSTKSAKKARGIAETATRSVKKKAKKAGKKKAAKKKAAGKKVRRKAAGKKKK